MKAHDVRLAVLDLPGDQSEWDDALLRALPVIKKIAGAIGGWKVWLRWGMAALIGAIEAYLRSRGYEI